MIMAKAYAVSIFNNVKCKLRIHHKQKKNRVIEKLAVIFVTDCATLAYKMNDFTP